MDILELDRIVFLLTDDNYKTELKTFRRSYQRLKIRLRNNQLNAKLKQLKTLIYRLEINFPEKLFQHYREKKPTNKDLQALINYISQFISRVDAILVKAVAVYCASQPHFRVGHLLQHYLVVRSSLARLIYCFKALLVYSIDLYTILLAQDKLREDKKAAKSEQASILTEVEALDILTKHNCKPKLVVAIKGDSPEIIEETHTSKKFKAEEGIGQLIDRETMRPVRSCRQKR